MNPFRSTFGTVAAILGTVVLGTALGAHLAPAHASAAADLSGAFVTRPPSLPTVTGIAAPAGDDGFWAALNPYLAEGVGAVVATVATWALAWWGQHSRVKFRAEQEASIRETMLTGAYAGMSKLELALDRRWTPAERRALVAEVVDWAQDRAAAQLRRLGLPGFVVDAMARKVIGGLVGASPFLSGAEPVRVVSDGNPGSTPALDRAVGGTGGA